MTLPSDCDVCGHPLFPWDDTEETPCGNCGSLVKPWEELTLAQRIRRSRLIERRQAVADATPVTVRKDVL